MRNLYLHVGVHRTGTTSTQKFFHANFNALLDKGYLYPFGVARHSAVVNRIKTGLLGAEDLAADLEKRMDARGSHVHSVVLSDEDMSQIKDFSIFAPLARHFDVKVVVSLRRQDLWLESWYLQNLKWQWNPSLSHLTFAEFFARRGEFFWIDYATRLAEYEALFGQGSVMAGIFETSEMPDGPIGAMLNVIGITDQSGLGPKLHHNSAFSPLTSEFMRHLPLDAMEPKDRRVIERAIGIMDAGLRTNGAKLVMSHDQRLIVGAEFAASNQATARRWFNRDTLFHDPLPDPAAPLATTALPADAAGLMQDFVVPMVRALGDILAEVRLADVPGPAAAKRRKGQLPKNDRVKPRT